MPNDKGSVSKTQTACLRHGRSTYHFTQDPNIVRCSLDGGDPKPMTRRQLLKLSKDGPVWDWLRSLGMIRPSPPGPSGPSMPEKRRKGVRVYMRMSRKAERSMDALCKLWSCTRGEAVERALAAVPKGDS